MDETEAPGTDTSTNSATPSTTITTASVAPQSPISFTSPAPSPVPAVPDLGYDATTDTLSETDAEDQETTLSGDIENLNDEMADEPTDTAAAYAKAGFTVDSSGNPTNATLTDLNNQLVTLKAQADAIPQQLQNEAAGRGITVSGLGAIQSAALRDNSVKALQISSMASALKNNLGTAKLLADQSVAAKYDPIQASLDAATKNLAVIKADPNTTIEEQNQAEAQKQALAQKQTDLDTAKTNAANVMSVAMTAAKNGADSATLQKIQGAPDGATALSIAAGAGFGTSDVNDLATKYPDAGIQPGDSLQAAQQKVLNSPSYTLTEKSAMLDVATKEEALATAAAESSPQAISTAVSSLTDYNGTKFYTPTDIQGMDAKTKQAFVTAAEAAGAKPLSAKDGDAMSSIQSAQEDLSSFSNYIQGAQAGTTGIQLPKNWLGQPQQYANVKFNDFLQSNGQLAAYSSWAAQIPALLSGLKGAGTGSGGSSRLFGTIENLLPSDTDTLPTALTKLQTINTILTNGANSILGTQPAPQVGSTVSDAQGVPDGATATGSDGKTYVAQGGQWVPQ